MRLYNTQSESVEPFMPEDNRVRLYVCGVTPYDTTHMGHAFTFLAFDILVRYLRFHQYEVIYVQNVTDIDDDILRKAASVGMGWRELGETETAKFLRDMQSLNALDPDHYVKATDHIAEMIAITTELLQRGFAYESNGSVYFSVKKDPEFGKLSHLPSDQMLAVANERGNIPDDPNKQDPLDFVLWQASKDGEPSWPSPWSDGRPGWHIECTAMATRYLGPSLDIHGGGADLIFPHHECEIAQSENATGVEPFSRFWMHVGMVEYQGEKMSKSLGNLVLASDALNDYSADALRLYLFSHHYRFPWEYRDEEMSEWTQVAEDLAEAATFPSIGISQVLDVSAFRDQFLNALDDDLDTPAAIAALREIGQAVLESDEEDDLSEAQDTLRQLGGILGLTLGASESE